MRSVLLKVSVQRMNEMMKRGGEKRKMEGGREEERGGEGRGGRRVGGEGTGEAEVGLECFILAGHRELRVQTCL